MQRMQVLQDEVTKATTKLQEAVNALQVKVTEKQNIGLKKPVTVSGTRRALRNPSMMEMHPQNGTVILSRVEQVMRHRTLAMHGLQLILGSR